MEKLRSVIAWPFKLIHKMVGFVFLVVLGTTFIAGGAGIIVGVFTVLAYAIVGALSWLLLLALLSLASSILVFVVRVIDPSYAKDAPTLAKSVQDSGAKVARAAEAYIK